MGFLREWWHTIAVGVVFIVLACCVMPSSQDAAGTTAYKRLEMYVWRQERLLRYQYNYHRYGVKSFDAISSCYEDEQPSRPLP